MSGRSPLELLDSHIVSVEDYLAELREQRVALLLVDQYTAKLGSLGAEIGKKQEQLEFADNHLKQLLSKLHLRNAA